MMQIEMHDFVVIGMRTVFLGNHYTLRFSLDQYRDDTQIVLAHRMMAMPISGLALKNIFLHKAYKK